MRAFPTSKLDSTDPGLLSGASFDEGLTPLMILLTSIAKWDLPSREIIKARVTPVNLKRDMPLDKGDTLTSRMIAFMVSTTLVNLKATASELMFVCCDESAATLVAYIGYGHAAGFLFERGINPADVASSSISLNLDPISASKQIESTVEEMTQEEKEVEAEKLYCLMDRLSKQGIIKPVFKHESA